MIPPLMLAAGHFNIPAPIETYDEVITRLAPTFRWTLNGTTAEVGGHGSAPIGAFTYASTMIPDRVGTQRAYFNDANSNEIVVTNNAQINTDPSSEKRSISLFVESAITLGGNNACIYEQGGNTHNWEILQTTGGDILAHLVQSSQSRQEVVADMSALGLDVADPFHLTFVFDMTLTGENMFLYVNGQLADSAEKTFAPLGLPSHSGDVAIVGVGNSRTPVSTPGAGMSRWRGWLQDICYWSEIALSPQDVQDIFDASGL